MKNLILIASAVCFCLLISCNNDKTASGGMSDKAKKNLESATAVGKMFETGDFSKLGDYVAADGVDHSTMKGEVKGVDSMKAAYSQMMTTMGDMKNKTVKELADDDYVFQWMEETATAKVDDPAMGIKAGSTNTFNAIEVSKFNSDGKATDHWSFISWGDMMKMMPQPTMNNNMPAIGDTSKMKMGTKK